tara:strand:+ start:185 stop:595 length:411 start_codon:yes stop_codon:yes gene_type:complete
MNNRKQSFTSQDDGLIWEGMLGHKYTSEQPLVPGEDAVRMGPGNKIFVYRPVTKIVVPDEYILINATLSDDDTVVTAHVERKSEEPGNQAELRFDADSGNIIQHQDVAQDTTVMPGDPDATQLGDADIDRWSRDQS